MDTIFGVTNKSTKDVVYAVDRMAERAERPGGRGEPEHSAADTCVLGCGKSKKSASLPCRDMPIRVPKELLFHLAYYSRTGIPYIKAMKHHAAPPV